MIFGTIQAHAMFFTARDASNVTDDARWFQGVKRNIKRAICERMIETGAEIDETALPVHLGHIVLMIEAYSKLDGIEIANRKLALLTAWYCAGCSAESSLRRERERR